MGLAVHRLDELAGGVPLVLLHAFPLDARMWDQVLPGLGEAGVPAVTVDAPGFGGSPATAPGLDDAADGLDGALRAAGVERAAVAGVSMGGYLAMALAARAPGVVAGLALVSTKAAADAEPAREKRLAMAAAAERGDPAPASPMADGLLGATSHAERPTLVAQVRDRVRSAPAAGIAWAQRSMAARPDRLATLAALPTGLPALVLRGAEDGLMSEDDAAAMAAALDVAVTSVPAAGHLLPLERPDVVVDALTTLWRRATA